MTIVATTNEALEERRSDAVRGDREIDDALDDSFPASDPPSWWAGADRPLGGVLT